MENLPVTFNTRKRENSIVYFTIYTEFLNAKAIYTRTRQKKKIVHALTYKENSWTWNSRICIAYCVRQQNGIAIINENIVGCPVLQNMIQCFPYASLIRYRYNGTAMAFCFLTFIITRKENSVCSCTAAKRGQREIGRGSRSRDRVRAIEDWFLRRIQSAINGRGKKYENVSRANRSATAAESAIRELIRLS